jgi:alpha-glucosidase
MTKETMNILKQLAISLQFLGLPKTLLTLLSTLKRDVIEWRFRSSPKEQPTHKPGPLRSLSISPQGASFEFTHTSLEIHFLKADLVCLNWGPGKDSPPYAVTHQGWPNVAVNTRQTPQGGHALSSEKLTVDISSYGDVNFLNKEGHLIRSERPPRKEGSIWHHDAVLEGEERIHGLGEKAAPLNLRVANPDGERASFEIRNQDIGGHYSTGDDPLYLAVPLYISRKGKGGYLVFYDNPFRGTFTFDHPESTSGAVATATFQGGLLRYYFTSGPLPQLLQRYTELTGRPPLPPRWALGYHQSRWGYKTTRDVQEVASGFKEHDMPLSAFHLDIDYMDGYRIFTIDEDRFPDLTHLSKQLHEDGVRLVTILDPCVKKDNQYFLYQEGKEQHYYCTLPNGKPVTAQVWPGWSVFPDFTHSETRTWWGSHYDLLLEKGVNGFWHDMNEPAAFAAWGEPSLPLPTQYQLEGLGGDHVQANNLYGLLMNKAGYEGLTEQQPDRRPWLLSRSGWAGNQRYAWNWTGDVSSSWSALRQTLVTMLNLGLSGIPYTGSDIGGFGGHPSPELFTRWFQLAAFNPFFRGHSATGTPRREPWVYGEPYTSIIRTFLKLRYQLLPYLYTLAWKSHQTGHPLMRPLFWSYGDHPLVDDVEDAFLLGEDLLVVPILEENQTSKQVAIPSGEWISYWDDRVYQGPDEADFETPLERIPLLVRAGCVLPMEVEGALQLHLYPPSQPPSTAWESDLYLDAGDGFGPRRLDQFTIQRYLKTIHLTWQWQGKYPFPYETIRLHVHGQEHIRGAKIDGKEMQIEGNKLQTQIFNDALFTTGKKRN